MPVWAFNTFKMSVGLKKLLRGGWQVLRQTVWKEATQPSRPQKLHGWDLRNNCSPNYTNKFRNVLVTKKLPYSQIHSVWETLSARLTKDAVQRLFSPLKSGLRYQGSTRSYVSYVAYGFVGLALTDHGSKANKSINDSDNFKNLCDSINSQKQKDEQGTRALNNDLDYPDNLRGYHFDKLIGQGCYGAIFAAKLAKNQTEKDESSWCLSDSEANEQDDTSTTETRQGEMESEEWDFISQNEMDVDDSETVSSFYSASSDWMTGSSSESIFNSHSSQPPLSGVESLTETDEVNHRLADKMTDGCFNLAVKVIFNDRVQSDACAIESAFESEKLILSKKYKLQQHPNIAKAHRAFVDDNILPNFSDADVLFPRALPRDKFQNGRGRNKLLFLVMHRYEMTLGQYLQNYPCRSEWNAQLMLCQLLEGAAFLCSCNIVHNDLKDNNILVELDSSGMPRLAITDFGCSSAAGEAGLQLSCPWYGVSMAGNSALRAPEIKAVFNRRWPITLELDYRKSDAWAIGSIAYQICGMENPFYQRGMDSLRYNDNRLPQLPMFVSPDFKLVIWGLLKKDPSERFSSDEAANMVHLLLWKQDSWNEGPINLQKMSYLERNLHDWLNQIVKPDNTKDERTSTVETELLTTFFSRVDSKGLLKAANLLTIGRWLRWFRAKAARMNIALYDA